MWFSKSHLTRVQVLSVNPPMPLEAQLSRAGVGFAERAGVEEKLCWHPCSLQAHSSPESAHGSRAPTFSNSQISNPVIQTQLATGFVTATIHRTTYLRNKEQTYFQKAEIGECWEMLGWTRVLSPESLSPLQTLRQIPCNILRDAFLGLLPFENPIFPHDRLLGCVRQILKQQTTSAFSIMDSCETLLFKWQVFC